MLKQDYDSLLELGRIARTVKAKILSKCFKTDKAIYDYLMDTCVNYNVEFSFPPLIAQDFVISHIAIDPTEPINLTETSIYTIDFGFKNKKTKMLVDNSVTVTNDVLLESFVSIYSQKMKLLEQNIQTFLQQHGFLTIEYLSWLIVDLFSSSSRRKFSENSGLYLIPFACSHTIDKDKLHGLVIPHECNLSHYSQNDAGNRIYNLKENHTRLHENTVFTIEPHVLILNGPLWLRNSGKEDDFRNSWAFNRDDLTRIKFAQTPANVVLLDGCKYITLKDALAQKIKRYQLVKGLWSNYVSFFNENTYLIRDRRLIQVT